MSESDFTLSSQAHITPEEITQRSFSTKVRGVSETEVRSFLRRVSDEVTRLTDREKDLVAKIKNLEESLKIKPEATKQELLERLGEQTSRILVGAEEAAEQMLQDAKERSTDMLEKAEKNYEAMHIKTSDERAKIEKEIEAYFASAKERADKNAEMVVEQARIKGREIFEEATVTREKILKDLLRRRELLSEQIDELRKGREELLDSYKVVKGSFQKATDALVGVENKAASELMASPIDVDELLAAHVELPDVLNSKINIKQFEDEIDLVKEEAKEESAVEVSTELQSAVNIISKEAIENSDVAETSGKEIYDQEEAESKKSKSIKNYVKDALGVTNAQNGDTDTITRTDAPEVDIEAKSEITVVEETVKVIEDKKDVSALFANLKSTAKEVKPTPKDSAIRKTEEDPEEVAATEKKKAPKKSKATTPIELRDEVVAEFNSAALRKAKKQLQNEQNELLDALRTTKSKKKITAGDVLPSVDAHIKMWSENLRQEIEGIYEKAASKKIQPSEENVVAAISWVVDPLREALTLAIEEGDFADVTTRVGAKYREWRNNDLKIALTDSLCATYSLGVLEAAPKGAMMQWVVEKAGQCVDCDDNALEPTKANEAFPTGQAYAPAHSGCRCVIAAK